VEKLTNPSKPGLDKTALYCRLSMVQTLFALVCGPLGETISRSVLHDGKSCGGEMGLLSARATTMFSGCGVVGFESSDAKDVRILLHRPWSVTSYATSHHAMHYATFTMPLTFLRVMKRSSRLEGATQSLTIGPGR